MTEFSDFESGLGGSYLITRVWSDVVGDVSIGMMRFVREDAGVVETVPGKLASNIAQSSVEIVEKCR